jgi:hypothetical protein
MEWVRMDGRRLILHEEWNGPVAALATVPLSSSVASPSRGFLTIVSILPWAEDLIDEG